jgi:hypothetical protein
MTRQSFAQEYDLDFLTSGEAVFEPADLARCRDGWVADPLGCDEYVTGWDIGRRQDHTVGITLGRRGDVWHVVDFARVLEPYPAVQLKIEERTRAYPGPHLVESNGVGDPVIENLTVRVEPFVTTPRTKVQAIQALQLLVQKGYLKYGTEEHMQLDREMGLYQWDDSKLVQDCVMALAIAAQATDKPVGETRFF